MYLNRATEKVKFEGKLKLEIDRFLEGYFKKPFQENLFPLYGGHSDAKNYFFELNGVPYILRVENPNVPVEMNLREIFSFQQAMKAGIAPCIYSVSSDSSFVLIEYLNVPTLSLQNAKSHLSELATALSKLHAMPINPYANRTQVDEFLEIDRGINREKRLKEFDTAVAELRKLEREIRQLPSSFATLHSDLHPRNLFLMPDRRVLAVDWEMTNVDDPFYDLTYCSVLHGFNEADDLQFLTAYLKRTPAEEELRKYSLCKRAAYIFLSILCFSQAQESSKENPSALKTDSTLKGWDFYIQGWSKKGEHEAGFFYEWGGECLKKLS